MPKTIAVGATHPGTVRSHNEDAFFLVDEVVLGLSADSQSRSIHTSIPIQFYAVADGMGGRGIGDAAAAAALAELEVARKQIRYPARFDFQLFAHDYLLRAGEAVFKTIAPSQGLYAGTALTLLCLTHDSAYVLSLGNCRCYRLRGGQLTRLTEDDVFTDTTPHRLSRYLGHQVDPHQSEPAQVRRYSIQQEDLFLLATDGLTEPVSEATIMELLLAPGAFAFKPGALMNLALDQEARDNLTLILIRVLDLAEEETQSRPAASPVRHRRNARNLVKYRLFRAFAILATSILTGFVAGWLLLTIFF